MQIQLISKHTAGLTGLSRYAMGLHKALQSTGNDVLMTCPASPVPMSLCKRLKRIGIDIEAFFASYPLRTTHERADIYHLTSQTLATLLLFQRFPKPVVVTVHDIIPFIVQHNPELNTFRNGIDYFFYRLALLGLRRADVIIADSEHTKRTLNEELSLPDSRIRVVYAGADHEKFRPIRVPDDFRTKYGLDKKWRYVLNVGSDDPRKNLQTLVMAFALIKKEVGDAKLVKVGAPHFVKERLRIEALISELGLDDDVLFFDHVPDEDLPLFYNAAEVFAMPSIYEGFGLPVVEAQACGIPVVCANAGSLPELNSGVGLLFDTGPLAASSLAGAILRVLSEPGLHQVLRARGLTNANSFRWSLSAQQTLEAYRGEVGPPTNAGSVISEPAIES